MQGILVLAGIVALHIGFFCASMGGHTAERGESPTTWDLAGLACLYGSVLLFCLSVSYHA